MNLPYAFNIHMYLNKPNRLEELDALRGIAALLVIFFHFTLNRTEYNSFFKLGTTGVDLFFMISGFVIFMSLQKISRGVDFVINRASRLYPTYWACVSFTFILLSTYYIYKGTFHPAASFIQFIGNLTMFQFYLGIEDIDGPYWTMIIEMLFYIFILILFKLKSIKYVIHVAVTLCCITVTGEYYTIKPIIEIISWIPLLSFLPLFLAGIIFYNIYTNKNSLLLNYSLLTFCLLCQLVLFSHAGRSVLFINQAAYTCMLCFYFILFILFVNKKLSFLVNKVTLFLGNISFALYLIHQCVSLFFIIPIFNNVFGINFWIVCICIDLPVIIGLATFITYKIEQPYSRKMKEKLRAVFIQQNNTRHIKTS
ncbi:acyltransferase family protein [Cytophaga hutchinsonii ATCC 33406]|uniref:Acyltransferase family protein n=2 Tax=Cytophaga hutchinsonii TaxID=985 RepID=A0A6N4SQP5_CYTH3|nr:acyltransferase family protein [Cytophaga hutchinsonii ATCC 33406]